MSKTLAALCSAVATVLGWALLAWLAWLLVRWGVMQAVWQPDAQACRLAEHGACWGVVPAKAWPLLLGHYPDAQQWRPVAVVALSLSMLGLWLMSPSRHRLRLWWASGIVWLPLCVLLMRGVSGWVPVVHSADWGGLPLTLLLFFGSWWLSVPLALLLALGRAQGGWVGWLATSTIELVRGVPLITLLFASVFALPLLLPVEQTPPLVVRAGLALLLFSAAYMAEVVRGGLQTVPIEQTEAGKMMGLGYWGIQRHIVLPQALRAVLPGMTGHTIGLLKDTSLVVVVGLHELTGGLSLTMSGDPIWRPYNFEAYLFVGLVYALLCLGLSLGGRRLERHWVTE